MKGLALFQPFLIECLAFFSNFLGRLWPFYWSFGLFWKNKSGNPVLGYKPNSAYCVRVFLITEKTKDLSCGFHTNWYAIYVYSYLSWTSVAQSESNASSLLCLRVHVYYLWIGLDYPYIGWPLTMAFSAILYLDNILSVNRIMKEYHYYRFSMFVWRCATLNCLVLSHGRPIISQLSYSDKWLPSDVKIFIQFTVHVFSRTGVGNIFLVAGQK